MTTVLVTDGEERAALATVRSLGRAGYRVVVCSPRPRSLAGASRHAARAIAVRDPLREPGAYVQDVTAALARERVDVLLPVSEQSLRAVLPLDLASLGVRVPFPADAVFRRVSDKHALLQAARQAGLDVPAQHVLEHADDARRVPPGLTFPLVIKPSRSVIELDGGRAKLGVAHAATPEELRRRLDDIAPSAYPVMLQERVIGPGIGVFVLLWDGEVRAVFAHRRLREKPPAGGVSVYRESVAADAGLVQPTVTLLRSFGWQGVAMAEFKRDAATGRAYLMEVNGRLWGSLQLAIDAGVDFPALLVAAALGRPLPEPGAYRVGVRSRWWWGDVDHLITRLRHSARSLDLPPGEPGRLRVIAQFLQLWRPGDRNEILRWDDPSPFVRETLDWFRRR